MFLQLNHQQLDIYRITRVFAVECYKITRGFPSEERFALSQQIRRAVLSVHLNIAEGCSRKSAIERKRFYEIARGSLIEVDTALDIAIELGYTSNQRLEETGKLMIRSFQLISKMIG